jgi:hypothetical protein
VNNCSAVVVPFESACPPRNLAYDPKRQVFYWSSYPDMTTVYACDREGKPLTSDGQQDAVGCGFEYVTVSPSTTQITQLELLPDGSLIYYDSSSKSVFSVDVDDKSVSLFFPNLPFAFDGWVANSEAVFFAANNQSVPFQMTGCVYSLDIHTRAIRHYGCYADGFAVNTVSLAASETSLFIVGTPHLMQIDISTGAVTSFVSIMSGSLSICGASAFYNLFSLAYSEQDDHFYVSGDVFIGGKQSVCFARISRNGTADPLYWDTSSDFFLTQVVIVNSLPPSYPVPVVTGLNPKSGPRNGQKQMVAVSGANFKKGAVSLWGGVVSSPCIYSSSTVLFCSVPQSPIAGQALLQISNDGQAYSAQKVYFTYLDPQ